MPAGRTDRFLAGDSRWWPWMILGLLVVPAIWHVVDFPNDVDPEFPRVARPTFSPLPPPAYRLAEPGDTIDRVALYLAAGVVVLSAFGLRMNRRAGWLAPLAIGLAATWHAATPGPTFDGWRGLGWRVILDPDAPSGLRATLVAAATGLAALLAAGLINLHRDRGTSASRRPWLLFFVATILVAARQFEIPGVEPAGYWPRWAFVWGVAAYLLGLIRLLEPPARPTNVSVWIARGVGAAAWVGLVIGGIWVVWLHRPLSRLRTVEPGKIYISAMPTWAGLRVAHERHRFKTIINVFAEDTHQRSPLLPDELRFVREHGVRYLNAPAQQSKADAFLDETLRLAQDPEAWPILVHCHGCMDRSPAWMGIYRFLVQKRPLEEILREIESHRGYRPKASVTLLYNRVLSARDPERYRSDPVGRILLDSAKGTVDPYFATTRRELEKGSSVRR